MCSGKTVELNDSFGEGMKGVYICFPVLSCAGLEVSSKAGVFDTRMLRRKSLMTWRQDFHPKLDLKPLKNNRSSGAR